MNRVVVACVALLALAGGSATAADLPPYYQPGPAYNPIYTWTGFYLGINGGGASSRNCWDVNNIFGIAGPDTAEGCHNATGGVVGGQVGYRWQSANWVFGLEAQGDWANLRGSNSPNLLQGAVGGDRTKIDAYGTITGQIGYAWNNVLWYVKGGAAVTDNKYSTFFTATGVEYNQTSETRWGGAVGTGIEVGFAPNWSVAVEYDHLFMGTRNVDFFLAAAPFAATRTDRIRQDVDMVTVRVNYRWGGPFVPKY